MPVSFPYSPSLDLPYSVEDVQRACEEIGSEPEWVVSSPSQEGVQVRKDAPGGDIVIDVVFRSETTGDSNNTIVSLSGSTDGSASPAHIEQVMRGFDDALRLKLPPRRTAESGWVRTSHGPLKRLGNNGSK